MQETIGDPSDGGANGWQLYHTLELAYWLQQLKGVSSALDLPADHPRPAVSFRGGNVYRQLSLRCRARGRSVAQLFLQ